MFFCIFIGNGARSILHSTAEKIKLVEGYPEWN